MTKIEFKNLSFQVQTRKAIKHQVQHQSINTHNVFPQPHPKSL